MTQTSKFGHVNVEVNGSEISVVIWVTESLKRPLVADLRVVVSCLSIDWLSVAPFVGDLFSYRSFHFFSRFIEETFTHLPVLISLL